MNKVKQYMKEKKRIVKWYINKFILKYDHIYVKWKYYILAIIKLLSFIAIYIFILSKLNIIHFKENMFNSIEYKEYYNDLVIAQISITFLTTAILSLISSLEDKYIFGEKLTNRAFGYRNLKFYMSFSILNILMIVNIFLMIKQENASWLISMFILSIYILIDIVNKIGHLFLSTKKERSILLCEYYEENINVILNMIVPRNYNSEKLVNLKEQTIKLILNKDVKYMDNIGAYKIIINKTFYNYSKEIQRYYLLIGHGKTMLDDMIEIIDLLIVNGEINRAINIYEWILKTLDYYNIYINTDRLNVITDEIINKIIDLKNEYKVKEYLSQISTIVYGIQKQLYFGLTNDFTYITDDRSFMYYSFSESKYFERIYNNIYNSKYLTDIEKRNCYVEIFEIFRMSCLYSTSTFNDITNYSPKHIGTKERILPICILGQATSLLFLSMMKNKDDKNIKLFMQMNIGEMEMYYAIHTMILTLLKMKQNKENENIYCDYYGIDFKWCKDFINKNFELIFCTKKNEEYGNYYNIINKLKESYEYICKCCEEKSNDFDKNFHFINYMCRYERKLIDKYFQYLGKKYNKRVVDFTNEKDIENVVKAILPDIKSL